ncbi:hypothetical protein Btru_072966, partial [Bulinus truncatus]
MRQPDQYNPGQNWTSSTEFVICSTALVIFVNNLIKLPDMKHLLLTFMTVALLFSVTVTGEDTTPWDLALDLGQTKPNVDNGCIENCSDDILVPPPDEPVLEPEPG